jgi:hypothetical protein
MMPEKEENETEKNKSDSNVDKLINLIEALKDEIEDSKVK